MQDFQTNPIVFVSICVGWVLILATLGGAWRAFFEEPADAEE